MADDHISFEALRNQRHEKFAQGVAQGKTTIEAYQAAYGGSQSVASASGSRLLGNVKISARIEELKAQIVKRVIEKTAITEAMIIQELALLGFSNMADFVKVGPTGDPYTDFTGLDRDKAAAIGEITVEDFKDGRGDDARDVRRVKFKLLDKRAALVDIGKHLGMFKERVEHSGNVTLETLVLEAAKRRSIQPK